MHYVAFNFDPYVDDLDRYDENIPPEEPELFCTKEDALKRFEELPKEIENKYKELDKQLETATEDNKIWLERSMEWKLKQLEEHKHCDSDLKKVEFVCDYDYGGGTVDKDSLNIYDGINPEGYFDWYSIGGRWSNWLIENTNKRNEVNDADVKDIDWDSMFIEGRIPYILITEDGEWESKEWYSDSEWRTFVRDYVKLMLKKEDSHVWIYDFHA